VRLAGRCQRGRTGHRPIFGGIVLMLSHLVCA
jgi:hypothetical protein